MKQNIRGGQRLSKGIMDLMSRFWYLIVGVGDETEGGLRSSAGVAHFAGMCSYEDSLRRRQALEL